MDSNSFIDNIQVEKANAIARYNQFTNISRLFRAIEVFTAVALISWSSIHLPTVFKLLSEYIYACSSYLLNQHVVFLVGNVIVVVCYVLSTSHTGLDLLSSEIPDCTDISEDSGSSSTNNCKTSETDSVHSTTESVPILSQLKSPELVGVEQVVRKEDVTVKTEAETAIKQAVKQIERFRRTQSAKLSMEISKKGKRELRRSVTERRSLKTERVETLSNEEFRIAVEAFILKHQSLLKQQSM